jgi:pimeloyl-ACP methyl ester carboxylesterase
MEERRLIDTELGRLAVRVTGHGAPAVLWHSLFLDDRSWERIHSQLAAQRRLVLITGPGHGDSENPPSRYTMEDCADAAQSVLVALGISEPVDWVGNAWGGHVGLVFASRRPALCKTLVTIGTPVQGLNRLERTRTIALLLAHRLLGNAGFVQAGVVNTLLSRRTRTVDRAAIELVEDCLANADRRALRNAVVSISLRRPDLSARLPHVSVPTLFITGSDHDGWTPQQAASASHLLPHGSSAVIADTAYLPPLEAPEETAQLIHQFWVTHTSVMHCGASSDGSHTAANRNSEPEFSPANTQRMGASWQGWPSPPTISLLEFGATTPRQQRIPPAPDSQTRHGFGDCSGVASPLL